VRFPKPSFTSIKKVITRGLFAGVIVNAFSLHREETVRTYVEMNLEHLIHQQEKKLHLKYPEELPLIKYHIPSGKKIFLGIYDRKTNQIFLQNEQFESPDWDFSTVKDTLNHELGHYYTDKLSERLTNHDWPEYTDNMNMLEIMSIKLISEGTATYFERSMNEKEDTFTDEKWPKALGGFFSSWELIPKDEIVYSGGYHLVKPIIDQHGEKGIIYLMFNTPKISEMYNLPGYQQRILRELSQP